MRQVPLTFRHALSTVLFVTAAQALIQAAGESLFAQQSQATPSSTSSTHSAISESVTPPIETNVGQSVPSDLALFETKVRPAVIWVTAFDPKGNLLRTESGFFISADGRFV